MSSQSINLSHGHLTIVSTWNYYKRGGDLLVFIAISLAMALFIGQERIISKGELTYWLLILPAALMPLLRFRQTVGSLLLGRALPIAIFGSLACVWCLVRKDFGSIPPVVLFTWVAGWACRDEARIDRQALYAIAVAFFVAGCALYYSQQDYAATPWLMEKLPQPAAADSAPEVVIADPEQKREGMNINGWGVLPGQTAPAFQPWRISVTPNIATSGIFSLLVLLIALGRVTLRPAYAGVLISSTYFAVLSFVRAVFVSLALFGGTFAVMRFLRTRPVLRVLGALLMVVGVVFAVAMSPLLLYHLQDIGIVSRMFLRGLTDLSVADIYRQAYRPWLWAEHVKLFWESPYLMGQGSGLAASATKEIINAGHARSDSISLLTRLLATYGLPTFALFAFLCERCYRLALNNDAWGVAMLSVLVWLTMTWGSIFHPTNGFFVLAFAIFAKGSEAFYDRPES